MINFEFHLDIFSKKNHNYRPAKQSYPLKWVSNIVRYCQQNMFHSALGQEKKSCCSHWLTHLKKKKKKKKKMGWECAQFFDRLGVFFFFFFTFFEKKGKLCI